MQMKIVVLTSNAIRHRFVANTITQMADASLVVCEAKPSDAGAPAEKTAPDPVDEHFRLRFETEAAVFGGHTSFQSPVLPILYRELNLPHVVDVEQTGCLAGGMMFLDGTGWILHRHLPTGEGHHSPAVIYVPLIQLGFFQFFAHKDLLVGK